MSDIDAAKKRLEQDCEHFVGMEDHKADIRLLLDEVERLREEMKHNDPASYSSMVYWREHCFKARAEVERLRPALEALEEIGKEADHGIPFYAYGDNEAGCEFSTRLSWIYGRACAALRGER